MEIKKQIVVAVFEVDVNFTDENDLLVKDTEPDNYGDYYYTKHFTEDMLVTAMNKAKLHNQEYRLEIKVISVL